MKFLAGLTLSILAAVPALAAPQEASSVSSVATTTVSLTPTQTCLASCKAGDVTCQAACVGTAHPNESQVNETTQCAMKCDQGDGSPSATQKYSECVQSCISSYFPTSQTVAAAAGTGSAAASNAASATGSGTSAAASGSATKTSGSSSSTGSAGASSSSGAAVANQVGVSAVGLTGLFMAIFAL